MTIDTQQYTEFVQQGQDAVRKTVEAWTRTVKAAAEQLPTFAPQLDTEGAIDRYFDFNEQLLGAQRDLAKRLVGYATAAGAAVRETAETVVNATPKA
jgi:hypothetical protein